MTLAPESSWKSAAAKYAKSILAIAIMVGLWALTMPPALSATEESKLASRFAFVATDLPVVPGREASTIRAVHPDLEHIASWISTVGAAVAFADLDNDGLPNDVVYVHTATDQVIVAPAPTSAQRYEPFAIEPIGIPHDERTTAPMGVVPCDMNEDGLMDLLVYYWGRPPVAFLRKTGSSKQPLSAEAFAAHPVAPSHERWFTNAATFADVDGDGHLDLIVGNYFPDGARILDPNSDEPQEMQDSMSRAVNGGRNRVLLWNGGRSGSDPSVEFREAVDALPDVVARGWTLALAAADLDGDLLPELYVANDFGPSYLLHNRSQPGNVRFEILRGRKSLTSPNSKVLGRDSFKGMGADIADLTGDGHPDIYVSNIATDFGLHESHFLWASTGELHLMQHGVAPYIDRSEPLGLSRSGWGWDTKLADFNNSGVLEAVQATGFAKGTINRWPDLHELAMANDALVRHPKSWLQLRPGDDLSGHEHNPFFVRSESGRYFDISPAIGLDGPMVSRGIAIADVDGDGRLELAFGNQWEPSKFLHNVSPGAGSFLGLHIRLPLTPTGSTECSVMRGHPAGMQLRPAVGAWARVDLPSGAFLVGQVDGGNGHSGVRSPDLHFGLGGNVQTSKRPNVQRERSAARKDRVRSTPSIWTFGRLDVWTFPLTVSPSHRLTVSPGRDAGATDEELAVTLRWRDPDGHVHEAMIHATPGWHTVVLGWPGEPEKE